LTIQRLPIHYFHLVKILIIRFSSIGDIVLTSPVMRCIRKQIPSAEIHYLTKFSYREVVEYNPHISFRHYFKDDLGEVVPDLRKEKFDFIVDLHNNFRSLKVRSVLRRRSKAFNKINLEKWLYVNLNWNIMPEVHIVDRYLETVKELGVKNDGEGLDYFFCPEDEIRIEELPLTHLHGYIAIAIGAQHATKKLPLEKLKTLVSILQYPIILLGGKEDFEIGEVIRNQDPFKTFNGCGRFSINQSASLIRLSKLVITHDTGMMHVAAAFKKKIISLWGNTVPEFGMYPYYGSDELHKQDYTGSSKMIGVRGLSCRPCSKLGFEKCPRGHFNCMNKIDVKEIASLVGSL
jgi:ADP-heptose:LPS heptosyltransferase